MKKVKRLWLVIRDGKDVVYMSMARSFARAHAWSHGSERMRVIPVTLTWTEPKPKRRKRA